jgi:HK97 family phage major capsid protein
MTVEMTKSVETALAAFNEYKGMVEGFKDELKTIKPKMDAFDEVKFEKLQKDIGKAIEEAQAEKARTKALEDQKAAMEAKHLELEKDLTELKTAFNRAPAADGKEHLEKSREVQKKLFNDFARTKTSNNVAYDEFLKSVDVPEAKTLSAGGDPSGGYLLMPEFGGVIKTYAYESSPIRTLASVTTIGTDTLEYVLDNDANTSGWVGEQATRPTTNTPTFGKLIISVNELYSNPSVTQKLLDDAMFDVEAWLAAKVAEEFGRKEATAFVTGNGVAQPKGIMSYASSGASTTTTVAAQQIEQVVTGDAANFTYNGLVNLQNSLKEDYQTNAVFLFRRASNANIMLIKDGQGHPIFNMSFDKNVGLQPSLMGQPCYYAADIAAIGSNALAMAYGDVRKAYQIVDRTGIRILRDPYSGKPNVSFYTTKRVGGGVVNCEAIKIAKIST